MASIRYSVIRWWQRVRQTDQFAMSSYFGIPIRNGIALGLMGYVAVSSGQGDDAVNSLLIEAGDKLLQEDNSQILLES